jgi:hypothetical protein
MRPKLCRGNATACENENITRPTIATAA